MASQEEEIKIATKDSQSEKGEAVMRENVSVNDFTKVRKAKSQHKLLLLIHSSIRKVSLKLWKLQNVLTHILTELHGIFIVLIPLLVEL